jgi:putative transposase
LWRFYRGNQEQQSLLSAWPLPRPPDWVELVNTPLTSAEEEALRVCAQRGTPYGDGEWVENIVHCLGLVSTLRPRGRPRKKVSGTFFEGS